MLVHVDLLAVRTQKGSSIQFTSKSPTLLKEIASDIMQDAPGCLVVEKADTVVAEYDIPFDEFVELVTDDNDPRTIITNIRATGSVLSASMIYISLTHQEVA